MLRPRDEMEAIHADVRRRAKLARSPHGVAAMLCDVLCEHGVDLPDVTLEDTKTLLVEALRAFRQSHAEVP